MVANQERMATDEWVPAQAYVLPFFGFSPGLQCQECPIPLHDCQLHTAHDTHPLTTETETERERERERERTQHEERLGTNSESTICRESPTHQLRHFVGIAVLKRRPTVLWLYVLQGQTCLSLGFVPNLLLKLLLRKKLSALCTVLVWW